MIRLCQRVRRYPSPHLSCAHSLIIGTIGELETQRACVSSQKIILPNGYRFQQKKTLPNTVTLLLSRDWEIRSSSRGKCGQLAF